MLASGPLDSLIRWLRRKEAANCKVDDARAGEGAPLISHKNAEASSPPPLVSSESAVKEKIVVATAALCCT